MKFLLTLGLIALLAGPVLAADQVQVQQEQKDYRITMQPRVPGACDVGNLNEAVYNYGNWIMGGEKYAYLVDPAAEGCGCDEGFRLDRVSMMMQFGTEDAPVTFDAYGSLTEALWDDAASKYVPGEPYCSGPTWSITADQPGLYDIYVDLDGGCECAALTEPYFVMLTLPNEFVWWPDAMEDDDPRTGVCYYDSGTGWSDLVADFGWWGNNIMHGEVTCCTDPVATDSLPLDGLKALYR